MPQLQRHCDCAWVVHSALWGTSEQLLLIQNDVIACSANSPAAHWDTLLALLL